MLRQPFDRWMLLALFALGCPAFAQSESRTFTSPEAAVEALVAALEKNDTAELLALLGPGSEGLIDSGDTVQDATDRRKFVAAYHSRHALVPQDANRQTLIVGTNEWPFPAPLVRRTGGWVLDGKSGADEIIYRRIGGNELGAIAFCRGFVEARREYAQAGRDGDPAGIYAMKLMSDAGRQNGLYWPTSANDVPSPAGPFVAAAAAEGYRRTAAAYHGYRYRMLYAQGPKANGGAREYFKDGLLTEGFALLAWPAEYGVSGIMTFSVNQDGVVYQRDLGANTDTAAAAITRFDPNRKWKPIK